MNAEEDCPQGFIPKEFLCRYDGEKNCLVKVLSLPPKPTKAERGAEYDFFLSDEEDSIGSAKMEKGNDPRWKKKFIPDSYKDVEIPIKQIKSEQEYEMVKDEKDAWIFEHGDLAKVMGYYNTPDLEGSTSARSGTRKNNMPIISGDISTCFIVALGSEKRDRKTGVLEDGLPINMSHNFGMRAMMYRGNIKESKNKIHPVVNEASVYFVPAARKKEATFSGTSARARSEASNFLFISSA